MSSGTEIANQQPAPAPRARYLWATDPLTWLSAVVVLGALAGLVQLFGSVLAGGEPVVPEIRGVPFGATAPETRERFEAPGVGQWRSFDEGDLHVLRWDGDGAGTYRFEFHAGLLVAVRATVLADEPSGQGAALEILPAFVLTRRPIGARVELTVLSRECPAHAGEVAQLLTPL